MHFAGSLVDSPYSVIGGTTALRCATNFPQRITGTVTS